MLSVCWVYVVSCPPGESSSAFVNLIAENLISPSSHPSYFAICLVTGSVIDASAGVGPQIQTTCQWLFLAHSLQISLSDKFVCGRIPLSPDTYYYCPMFYSRSYFTMQNISAAYVGVYIPGRHVGTL